MARAACEVSLPCGDSLYENKENKSKQGYVGLRANHGKLRGTEVERNEMAEGRETEHPPIPN